MLFSKFVFNKRKFFNALYARQLFLSYDFFCFMNFLSFQGNVYTDFSLFLKKNEISIFFISASIMKFIFNDFHKFNFLGAHCFVLYTNSLDNFFNILNNLKESSFLLPYAFLFKKNLLSINNDFFNIYSKYFKNKIENKNKLLTNLFSKSLNNFFIFSVFRLLNQVFSIYSKLFVFLFQLKQK